MSVREHRIELGVHFIIVGSSNPSCNPELTVTICILHIYSLFSARRHFHLATLILFYPVFGKLSTFFSPPTGLHLIIKRNLLYSLLQELSRFSVFLLSRHFKSPGVTIKSWSLIAFYLILSKFCRTTFSSYYFRSREVEFECRFWTANHPF